MKDKTAKHRNIPIFIPHLGCPNMCVFCNQRSISGKQSFRKESVIDEINEALETIPADCEVEIAFFGGSFTGIDRSLMIYLLDVAKDYVECPRLGKARISGIRMSTRPDYITEEIIEILSRYPVKTVELGLQSMDDEVLKASKRGHDARVAEKACEMIKKAGYELIGQMMIGLPCSTLEKELMTAERICEMGADGVRIYPTVTFYDTELADMAERGEYKMLEIEDAVYRSKEVLKVFNSNGVECIRLGLCASDNLGDAEKVKGGANHPALGELVQGELIYDRLRGMLLRLAEKESLEGKSFSVSVYKGELSRAIGQNGRNRERLLREFKLKELKFSETIYGMGLTLLLIE
jgi:histone acetyltransferase (RNA polymerase elongator complex component)